MKSRTRKKRTTRLFAAMMLSTRRLWGTHDRWTLMATDEISWKFIQTTNSATVAFRYAKRFGDQ